MQLEFDLDRRARSIAHNDRQLAGVGCTDVMRAVVWLLSAHPRSAAEGTARVLPITYEQAGAWLREHAPPFAGMVLNRSSVRKAVAAWWRAGVMTASQGRPTVLRLDAERLRAWWEAEDARREQSLSAWNAPPEFVSDVSDVSDVSVVSPSDREIDRKKNSLSLSEGGHVRHVGHEGHNGHEPESVASPGEPLPELPEAALQCSDGKLRAVLLEWWHAERLRERGFDPDQVIGAVLLARFRKPDHPQRYVQSCLDRGVQPLWLARAKSIRERASPEQAPYAPHGTPK